MIQIRQPPKSATDLTDTDTDALWLPAVWAVRDQDAQAIRALVTKGLNVNARSPIPDENKITLLMIAARDGADRAVFAQLLELGADIHARAETHGYDDFDAFELARRNGHDEVTDILLAACVERDEHGDDEWLRAAIENNQRDLVGQLLGSGMRWDLDKALNVAIVNDDYDLARQLVENGAQLTEGYTILEAVSADNLARVRFLADHSSSPVEGLSLAAGNGNFELVKLLLDYGAGIDEDTGSRTALHAAVAGGHFRIAEMLLKKGASVNTDDGPTYYPSTPLTSAIEQLHEHQLDEPFRQSCFRMIRKLLKHGANPDYELEQSDRDELFRRTVTAIDFAWMAGKKEPQLRTLLKKYSNGDRQRGRWKLGRLFRGQDRGD